jgi:hypothetical protein
MGSLLHCNENVIELLKTMRVRLVCYEDVHRWIIGKFALRLEEHLKKMGVDIDIDSVPDLHADVNHHIVYGGYGSVISSLDTLMITHIDSIRKAAKLKIQMQSAKMGICMSNETVGNLVKLGIPRSKLCYVNPAHDGIIKPRRLIIGITCRVQKDGRKRENFVGRLAEMLDPEEFEFIIMGEYWTPYVDKLRQHNFHVKYYESFIYEEYNKLIPSLDYYLYMGLDEGQMGFLDALSAGVKTIVTSQGYHLDAKNGITYPFMTFDELAEVFNAISKERKKLTESVSKWTWAEYSLRHLEIWNYLSGKSKDFPSGTNFGLFENFEKNTVGSFKPEKFAIRRMLDYLKTITKLIPNQFRELYYYFIKNRNRGY